MQSPIDADKKLKVFISYARVDLAFADQLYAALEAAGFEPLIDRHGIVAGTPYQQRLADMILEADTIVFVLSPASLDPKSFTVWEIGEAERLSKRVLPVVCAPIDSAAVPERLKRLDYPFFYDEPMMPESGFGKAMKRLTSALNSDLDWLLEHTRLLELATQWNVKRTAEHLLRGHLIEDAQKWMLSRPRTAPDVTPLHLEFIQASEAAQSLLDNEARQQLERIAAAQAEQAKALAAAEAAVKERERVTDERDTAQKRTAKLERQRTVISAIFGLVALALAGFALKAKRDAAYSEDEKNKIAASLLKQLEEQQKETSAAKAEEGAARAETVVMRNERDQERSRIDLALASTSKGARPDGDPSAVKTGAGAADDVIAANSALLVEVARKELAAPQPNLSEVIDKALRSLPDTTAGTNRPVVKDAEATLFEALQRIPRPLITLRNNDGGVTNVELLALPGRAFVRRFGPRWALVDTRTGSELWAASAPVAAASPDGTFIAYADTDTAASRNVISILDTSTGKPVPNLKITMPPALSAITTIDISANGKKIGVADGANSFAFVFDATNPDKAPVKVEQPATLRINRLIFSPDSRRVLALGYLLYTARIFDAETGRQVAKLAGGHLAVPPFGLIKTGAFSPDGKMIVTGGTDGIARRWTGESPLDPPLTSTGSPTFVSFSATGDRILAGTWQNTVHVWESASGRLVKTIQPDGARLSSAGFAADGKMIFVSWSDGSTELFDANGTSIKKVKLMKDGQSAAALSADGKQLLTGTDQGTVQLWTLDARTEIAVSPVKPNATGLSFTPDDGVTVLHADAGPETIDFDVPDVSGAAPPTGETSAAPPRSVELAGVGMAVTDPATQMTVATLKPSNECRLSHPTLNATGTFAAALCSDDTVRIWRVYRSTAEIVDVAKGALASLAPAKR